MKTKNRWSKGIALMALMMAVTGLAGRAYAVNPGTVDLTVTVNIPLSVSVGAGFDFGTMAAGASKINADPVTVTNDSSGLVEDFQIKTANTANGWAPADSPGQNAYTLKMLISLNSVSAAPNTADFAAKTTSALTLTDRNLSASNFGTAANSGDGNEVQPNAIQKMWFQLATPTSISAGNNVQQTVRVAVTAAPNSTF